MAAKLNVPLTELANLIDARDAVSANYLKVEKIAAPYTVVQNRALMPDLSKDLGVRIGTQRIMTQGLVEADGESVATGARVWKVLGDTFDQIRAIGDVTVPNDNEGARIRFVTPNTLDKIEITFYGTGLNVLHRPASGASDVDYAVDGVATGTLSFTGAVLGSNTNYDVNTVKNVVSGLALGTHTVTISNKTGWSGNPDFYGFEILTESTTLRINPGTVYGDGSAYTLQSAQSVAYNTGFESGTLGTKGGNVVVYLKEDGTIGKAVTPTDSTALYLTNTDHTNEEVIKKFSYYDFNTNRSDCLGNIGSSTDNAFTLDDGVTSMCLQDCTIGSQNGINGFVPTSTSDFFWVTFVGTGLDLLAFHAATNTDTCSIYVDNVYQIGPTAASTVFGTPGNKWTKICSGLKYGTHTVTVVRNSAAASFPFFGYFKVYGPKEPALPVNAKKISQYYLLGDYAMVTPSYGDPYAISQGVIRNTCMRGVLYSGTWGAVSLSTAGSGCGFIQGSTTTSAYYEYTFWGTGIDIFTTTNAGLTQDMTVAMDGSSNFTSLTTTFLSTTTGLTWTAGTGVISGTSAANSNYVLRISGLSLGKHTVRMTKGASTDTLYLMTLDVHTPIHSYQYHPARYDMLLGNSMVKREVMPESYKEIIFKHPVMQVSLVAGQLINSGVATKLLWDTVEKDPFRGYNRYSGRYIIKKAGNVSSTSTFSPADTTTWTVNNLQSMNIFVNEIEIRDIAITAQATVTNKIGVIPLVVIGFPVAAGDYMYVKGYQSSGDNVNTAMSFYYNSWGMIVISESEEV